ncbi:uncharacterized protein LOC128954223 [Oppia nitens]|uniref:uncharacterized protein LOC128954223 n=1 Tax=Oppia nitens TaxID=1686743 RepID=UPI0023DC080D|nr:uncharacterized protein LOC128954223 [Oppia nitens]
MDIIDPNLYTSKNSHAQLSTIDSIKNHIQNNDNNKSYDLIVDVGCGGGVSTNLLAKHIPQHKLIVGIDVVPDMISYARSNNTDDTIEYVEQDMSVKWTEIGSQRIRQLESKVDLIYSNMVLEYMPDKWLVMDTVNRLLTTGGLFHANIFILPDLNKKLVNNGPKPWYQTREKQLDDWRQSLSDNHLLVKQFDTIDVCWPTDRQKMIEFMPIMISKFRSFFKNRKQFDAELNDHLTDTVFDAYVNPDSPEPNPRAWQQFLADPTVTEVNRYHRLLRVTAIKQN